MSPSEPRPTAPSPDSPHPASERADEAARSVIQTFGHRLCGLPGTHVASPSHPRPPRSDLRWNYWWQAHYLDGLVDAAERHRRGGDERAARTYLGLGRRLLRTVWLRNLGRFTNDFYDDMAWLILAAGRLRAAEESLGLPPGRPVRQAVRRIAPQLLSATTDDLGGGLYWTTRRDRKNVPATAPAAIHFAQTGDAARARTLIDWIYATLYDEAQGLVLDTAYVDGRVDRTVYTYNQGVVLGALLALGDADDLSRAARLIEAVDAHQRSEDGAPILRTHGDGDGGLFTGILARYLAVAARDARLAPHARFRAAALVRATAQALWDGSDVRRLDGPARVFSPAPGVPAVESLPPGARLELTPQLQAWTILEAAAQLEGAPIPGPDA